MSVSRLVGVDVGTQGTKAGLFSTAGECLAEAFSDSALIQPGPGIVEEDPEAQAASVARTIRECIERSGAAPGDVAGVAIDGQMAGIIGIGHDGRCVTPYDSWLDTRCAPQIEGMRTRAAEILRKTGSIPSFNHGPKILWWKSERPETYRRVASFVQPGAYAAMRLCGLRADRAFIDWTYLHFSGFADNAGCTWDRDLCGHFGVDPSKLPAIVPPTRIVGRVSSEAAELSGLMKGTPVAAGCGDTAASFLSCGATEPGVCVDVAGTASVFAATTETLEPDEESLTMACGRSAAPGLWHAFAYINGGGLNAEWFRKELAGDLDLDSLEAEAADLPFASTDPLFAPHLSGRVMPSAPRLRGAWIGLDRSHTRGHLYRAVLEGVSLEYGIYLAILRRLYPGLAFWSARVTGGGARSALWNRIKASVCGMPFTRIKGSIGAPLGAAMVAGVAAGALESFAKGASDWVQTGDTVAPDPGLSRHFAQRLPRYEKILSSLTELS